MGMGEGGRGGGEIWGTLGCGGEGTSGGGGRVLGSEVHAEQYCVGSVVQYYVWVVWYSTVCG